MDHKIDLSVVRSELRRSIQQLSDRGLLNAAKWSAELLRETPPPSNTPPAKVQPRTSEVADEVTEDAVLLARSYFGTREFRRAAEVLKQFTDQLSIFIRLYCLYLDGERQKQEEALQRIEPSERSASNPYLRSICSELVTLQKSGVIDGFNLYLLGVVYKQLEQPRDAVNALVASVTMYPCNWSAWSALVSCCTDRDMVAALQLPEHWTRPFFMGSVFLELQQQESDDAIVIFEELRNLFPGSSFVLAQLASAKYNRRQFDEAQAVLEQLHEHDPNRLDNMDTLSNILYVKELRAELGSLVHAAVKVDKYRPETCCIVGNYYSLRDEHEKAIMQFKRALTLDPHFLSAWTLMGHEYVELRNIPAAIDAYRHAVDINPRDYRAWYGLGQTYEIRSDYHYSLYYFSKAASLRPYDARMWCAMAECYEKLERDQDAIQCYLRAEGNNDREGISLTRLAKLHSKLGDMERAADYHNKVLKRKDEGDEMIDQGCVVEALLFLAERCKNTKQYAQGEEYCKRLLEMGAPSREVAKAKSLQIEIRQLAGFSL